MQTPNANQSVIPNNPVWYLLAEYSLSEFLSDLNTGNKPMAGLLFKKLRDLCVSPEYVENIEMLLMGFVKEALEHFKGGRLDLPGRIRIFCQRKMIAEEIHGGWGYFLIEREHNVSTGSSVSSWNSVDLYLYKEGE
jgi:hypothetical protein